MCGYHFDCNKIGRSSPLSEELSIWIYMERLRTCLRYFLTFPLDVKDMSGALKCFEYHTGPFRDLRFCLNNFVVTACQCNSGMVSLSCITAVAAHQGNHWDASLQGRYVNGKGTGKITPDVTLFNHLCNSNSLRRAVLGLRRSCLANW